MDTTEPRYFQPTPEAATSAHVALREQVSALDSHIQSLVHSLERFGPILDCLQVLVRTSEEIERKPSSTGVSRVSPLACSGSPPCLLRLLGPVVMVCDAAPVELSRRGKAESILKALALGRDRRVPAALLAEWVWPGLDSDEARHCLQTTVSAMRRSFQRTQPGCDLVAYRADAYQLDPAVVTDIELFDSAYGKAVALERSGHPDRALETLLATLPLYRDDLEIDEFEDLRFLIERERLIGINLQILSKVSAMQFQRGHWEESIAYATRLLSSDPSREDAHRVIIRSYARLGQRSQAMHHYRLCERVIREHFDSAVEPETAALVVELFA